MKKFEYKIITLSVAHFSKKSLAVFKREKAA